MNKIAAQGVNPSHSCVKRTIYSINNTAIRRHRRFSATSVSNEIGWIRAKNRHAESDTQNLRTAQKTSIISACIGARFLEIPKQACPNSSQLID
ncbi:hypothetical protein [Burkholderia sp. Se-20378]|uniref:hypothetical protein n=1 Tax=Burkholderia sp. Se-20378 TaxID=2703899 RepID=UPI00197CE358|nr:hypothetical protein [Burkholderia sp. Se-20378]MBN3772626.1 hypothetical protein [Burkholderia sp. Se-20378]